MRSNRKSHLGLAMVAALALCACGKQEPPAAPGAEKMLTVRIGHAAPLTGPQAHLGKDNENGTQLALEEANARGITIGGRKAHFELISEDDQADPKQGAIVAQKFTDAKVNGVIGHLNSGTTIPASKIYSDAGIPQVSPSATNIAYTHQGFKTAFRVMAHDGQQGKALGEYATRQLAAKKIAIIDDRSAYGQGLADEFEKAAKASGGAVVGREFTHDKATDFRAILTAVKARKPDLVFYGGMDAQGGPMAKQMRSLGLNAGFLTGDGGCTPEFIKLAGDAAEGAYCSLPGVPLDKMPGGAAFRERYQARFHAGIQLYAPYCYDALNVMIAAMEKAGSAEPVKYLPELAKITLDGITTRIQFDKNGDIQDGAVTLYRVKAGKWEVMETIGGAPQSGQVAAAEKK